MTSTAIQALSNLVTLTLRVRLSETRNAGKNDFSSMPLYFVIDQPTLRM